MRSRRRASHCVLGGTTNTTRMSGLRQGLSWTYLQWAAGIWQVRTCIGLHSLTTTWARRRCHMRLEITREIRWADEFQRYVHAHTIKHSLIDSSIPTASTVIQSLSRRCRLSWRCLISCHRPLGLREIDVCCVMITCCPGALTCDASALLTSIVGFVSVKRQPLTLSIRLKRFSTH